MKKIFLGLSICLTMLLISGCDQSYLVHKTNCKATTKTPVIDNEVIIAFAKDNITLIPKGELLRVVIPDNRFFRNNLPAIKPEKYAALDKLAALLKQYHGCSIKIMGYSDNVGNTADLKMQSLNRARAILTYLWTKGFDAEHLYAIGYGRNHDVGDFNNVFTNAANNRVEIIVHTGCGVCL